MASHDDQHINNSGMGVRGKGPGWLVTSDGLIRIRNDRAGRRLAAAITGECQRRDQGAWIELSAADYQQQIAALAELLSSAQRVLAGPARPDVLAALAEAGIVQPTAGELAADPWVTPERIAGWHRQFTSVRQVRSIPAMIVTMLRNHQEPPLPRDDWRRFVTGKYAGEVR